MYKEEQSLFVNFMLNLAFIPDDALYALDNLEFGWSREFKKEMDNYYNENYAKSICRQQMIERTKNNSRYKNYILLMDVSPS